MKDSTIKIGSFINLDSNEAFDKITGELTSALKNSGIDFDTGEDGSIRQNSFECGRIIEWKRGKKIKIEWHPSSWRPENVSIIELKFEESENGTNISFEYSGLNNTFDKQSDTAGWFASEILGNLFNSVSPLSFGNWITDRRARRPFGKDSRDVYRDPVYHYPNFKVILRELNLQPDDYLIEIGCGGGAFLKMALQSGCKAAAIDHSFEMVKLALEENKTSVKQKRLEIKQSDAESLPYPDNTFTCASMTGVFGFLKNPATVLIEIKRVLKPGGRAIIMGTDPELKGTPAAPEPIASRLTFYESSELKEIGIIAGFKNVKVERFPMEQYAKESGIPQEHLPLFSGEGSRFLILKK